jgi:hypothetical protein
VGFETLTSQMFTRKPQCTELAMIFKRLADATDHDELRARKYRDIARECEAEAKRPKQVGDLEK